jgi:phage tail sheath protein FI
VSDADYLGTIDPATEVPTGLKALEDPLTVSVDFIAIPGRSSIACFQEIIRISNIINAVGIGDIPDGLNARAAIDWTNGQGAYESNGRIDSFRLAVIWNWWTGTDLFTGEQKKLPPSVGWLRTLARTFDQDKPWFAAAGVVRGDLPEALAVTYKTITPAVREAMYGNGNVVNPIIFDRNQIVIWGDLTMKRSNSKLQELHNVVLVNYIMANFSTIARKFVFDPIDVTLYSQLRTEFDNFLQSVKTERGLEDYSLVVDASNNTAATRNERRVQVDLSIIPISAAQNIDLDLVVEESGATLVNAE